MIDFIIRKDKNIGLSQWAQKKQLAEFNIMNLNTFMIKTLNNLKIEGTSST